MVIEHTFVTTLDAAETTQRARELLTSRGFRPRSSTGGAETGSGSHLEFYRGTTAAKSAKSVSELPQVVRMDLDRGRVTVAISIEASATWGGASGWGGPSERPQKMTLHTRLLTAIANALEAVLARGLEAPEATAEWDKVERDVTIAAEDVARAGRRRLIALLVVLGLIIVGIVLLVVLT